MAGTRFTSSGLLRPTHPERICWGCNRYCAADDLACGNGTIRTPHPIGLFGEDWLDWSPVSAGGAPQRGTVGADDGVGGDL